MSDSADLLGISKHLTNEYISQQLTKWFKKSVKYSRHEFGKGAGKGDSYLSDIRRVVFFGTLESDGTEVSVNTIIKSLPQNLAYRKTFRAEGFFRNEIMFYLEVLPALLEFQSEKNIKDPFDCYANIFASVTDGMNDFIALEDLSIHNFTIAGRQEGIDYAHCKIILETFAKYHALSFAYKDQNPENYELLKTKIDEMYYAPRHWNWYKNFWGSLCRCAIDAVEKEYPNTIYSDKIKEFATDKAFDKMVVAATESDKHAVFSHGDSWTPNFLLRYKGESKVPVEAKIIDFQLARCASPILDIIFFLYTCPTEDLLKNNYTAMLKDYHNTLSKQIEAMGSNPEKVYSWDNFMEEVKKYSYFALGFSFESIPATILDPDDAYNTDIEGTEATDVALIWAVKPIKSKAGRLRLAANVIHAVDNGYI